LIERAGKPLFDKTKERQRKETKKLIKRVGWLIFGIVISTVLFVLIASFFGWHFDVVPTRSMEPAFDVGGLVVNRPVELKGVKVGDTILFTELQIGKEARICHRVIDVREIDGQLLFQTKGDAAEYPDADLVSSQNFIGKTILYIPHVGNIAYRSHLHEAPITFAGKRISVAMLLVFAIGLIVIVTELTNILEWMLNPHLKRREEILKKRKHRLRSRRRREAVFAR